MTCSHPECDLEATSEVYDYSVEPPTLTCVCTEHAGPQCKEDA